MDDGGFPFETGVSRIMGSNSMMVALAFFTSYSVWE